MAAEVYKELINSSDWRAAVTLDWLTAATTKVKQRQSNHMWRSLFGDSMTDNSDTSGGAKNVTFQGTNSNAKAQQQQPNNNNGQSSQSRPA